MAVHAESSIQLNTIPAYTSLLGGHFVYRSTAATQEHPTPPSANIIEIASTPSNPSTWGYNTHIGANGIKLRLNETDLSEWSNGGLKFYKAPTISGNTVTKGALAMELTNSVLNFYGSSTSTPDATLNATGLKLVKGGIEAGTYSSSSTNFIYLSTDDYSGSPTITINGNSSGWRQIIGSKFGVKNDGTLYASNVDIDGTITATSGAIGGWTIGSTFLSTSASGTPGSGVITLSQGIIGPTSDSGVLPANQTWAFTANNNFGVTTNGTLYATGAHITGEINASSGHLSDSITIGSGANPPSVSAAIDDAATKATNYLSFDTTNGLKIASSTPSTATTNMIQIKPDNISIYGNDANGYSKITSNGLTVFANLDPDGDNVYTATQVASFGAEARIGIVNNNFSNIHITSDSMTISNKGVETYKIENATDREVKVKIDLNRSFQSGDTSFSLDIELGRTVSSWINTGGVRGIVLIYDLWGDDYGDISQSYNGPTVIDTEGKYAFTSELNGSVMTITFGPGATLDDEIIYFTSVEFNFIAADPVVHNTIGAYANNTLSSPFKIGVGTASIPSNAMLVDFSGNTKIKGDLFIKCNDDSTGGMPLGTVREYTQSSRPSGLRYLHIDAYQVGYTVTLVIEFQMATSTASVGNYFTQILQEIPAPAHQHMRISGFGYTGGAIVGYWLAWTDGFWQLSARNLSGTTTGSSFGLTASLTYVTDGTLCWDNY